MSVSVGNRGRSVARTGALCIAVLLLGLMAVKVLWITPTAHAQGNPPAFGQGPFGGGGQGMFGGAPPFVMGTVVEVGQSQKMIAVTSPFGGDERIIKITDQTKMVTEKEVKVSEIKVGDQVQVNGMPTGIRARSLTVGEAPEFFRMPGRTQGGGNQRGQGGQGGRGNAMRMNFASASGKVTAVNPLTIALDDTVSVVIRLAPDARIQKIVPVTLAAIKEGDRIIAGGTADSEGVLTATAVGVNMGGGMGGGMFGMPFGGPPGGPGGNRGGRPQGGAPPQ